MSAIYNMSVAGDLRVVLAEPKHQEIHEYEKFTMDEETPGSADLEEIFEDMSGSDNIWYCLTILCNFCLD